MTQAKEITTSHRKIEDAVYTRTIPAGKGWMYDLEPGQVFRITDLEGNQAADTLFYDALNPEDSYSAIETVTAQKNIYLTTGSVLRAKSGQPLLTITADSVGKHDTVGGACSAESDTVRYAHEKKAMHNCRDTFMYELSKRGSHFSKQDLAPNINFFMNVPITPEGGLTFEDGVSAPGYYVEMLAETNTTVLISNCPQLNNPCNDYNPTPIEVTIWNK